MSKRKADEAFGDDSDANDSPSWAEDLPDEVTHQIETTLACPKSVTAMEATCKSWRRILQKTDVSYWKPRALERFPRLPLMCKAREKKMTGSGSGSNSVRRGGAALGSWKKLYWRQLQAEHTPKRNIPPPFKPLTSLDDYALTVEVRLEGKMLFEETFTANDATDGIILGPKLWSYQLPEDREDENVPLDPRLISRIGSIASKDPFSEETFDENWNNVAVDVIVHRLSDFASVKLLENTACYDWVYDMIVWEKKQLPCRACNSAYCVGTDELILDASLDISTGEFFLGFKLMYENMTEQEVLRYLEVQCPWPTTG